MKVWMSSAKTLHRSGLGLAVTEQKYKSQMDAVVVAVRAWPASLKPHVLFRGFVGICLLLLQAPSLSADCLKAAGATLL